LDQEQLTILRSSCQKSTKQRQKDNSSNVQSHYGSLYMKMGYRYVETLVSDQGGMEWREMMMELR